MYMSGNYRPAKHCSNMSSAAIDRCWAEGRMAGIVSVQQWNKASGCMYSFSEIFAGTAGLVPGQQTHNYTINSYINIIGFIILQSETVFQCLY